MPHCKHGHSRRAGKTRTYRIWKQMRGRCTNANFPDFQNYGGRGIKRHPRWADYSLFLTDMGECPDGMSIDRINNDGDYEPGNCRWATRAIQSRNNRRNQWVTLHGAEMVIKDAAKLLGVSDTALINIRKRRGFTYQEAVDRLAHGRVPKQRGTDGCYTS